MNGRAERVAVIGAGAAGMMAALHAARAGAAVVLCESTRDGGRKILASGGGRCNILPTRLAPERFVSDGSPHTLRNLFCAWPLEEQKRFFERDLGLPLKYEAATDKWFPASERAKDVRDALMRAVVAAGAEVRTGFRMTGLREQDGAWSIEGPEPFLASRVVLCTGGRSVPRTGSDGLGIEVARKLGHAIVEPYPALTPLCSDHPLCAELAGIATEAVVSAGFGRRELRVRGGILITHRGFSGPAVLDLSHVVVRGEGTLRVGWFVDSDLDDRLKDGGARSVRSVAKRGLPLRLVDALCSEAGVDPAARCATLTREARRSLLAVFEGWELPAKGHEGYAKAEVTGGGVALAEVHPKTLESKRCRGLHLAGEILDAFGPIGGHNFAWAWSTGRRAGLAAARSPVD